MVPACKDADPYSGSLQLDLYRDPEAPAVARAATAGLCQQIGLADERCETLLLLVSEIVTNAVVHSNAKPDTPIRFSVAGDDRRVRIDVHDGGKGFTPEPREPNARPGGWGLHLAEQARSWGIEDEQGTLVWFELAVAPH